MNITAFIAIALLGILTFVGITHKGTNKKPSIDSEGTKQYKTITVTPSAKPEEETTPSANSGSSAPTLTPLPQSSSLNINDFIYPGSSQNSKSGSSANLTSDEDPSNIFSWYQQKVNSLHLGAKSMINTKTNGNTNDVIDAVGNGSEIKISITKNSGDSHTTINITISANNSNSVNNSVNSTNSTTINNNIDSTSDTSNTY